MAPAVMIQIMTQECGNDSGRAVGRSGDDAMAGGVLFSDRHGKGAHPFAVIGGSSWKARLLL